MNKEVFLIGMGMGNPDNLSIAALKTLSSAQRLIGSARLLKSLPTSFANFSITENRICEIDPKKIAARIKAFFRSSFKNYSIAVLYSGDAGFYSGASLLSQILQKQKISYKIISGISSVQEFSAALSRPWHNFRLVSAHGKPCKVREEISLSRFLAYSETFFLTDSFCTPAKIATEVCKAGFEKAEFIVGSDLSLKTQIFWQGRAEDFSSVQFVPPLSVVLVVHGIGKYFCRLESGIKDSEFLRAKTVPMTKEEVRTIIISKLKLGPVETFYDIGAGTGSVSIVAALCAPLTSVYAIEKKAEAQRIMEANCRKFGTSTIHILKGTAPDIFKERDDLPIPDAVFIGGSGGKLSEIIAVIRKKNPLCRFVLTAISLETLAQAQSIFFKPDFSQLEICQVSIAKTKELGNHNLFAAHNPVFILSCKGTGILTREHDNDF